MIKFIIGLLIMNGVAGELDAMAPDVNMEEIIKITFLTIVGFVFMVLGINSINNADEGK